MTFYVYTLRNLGGTPIYVGATNDPVRRMTEHATNTWWLDVDQSQITMTEHPDAESAKREEESLIAKHRPERNRAGVIGPYIPYRPTTPRDARPEYDETEKARDVDSLKLHIRNVAHMEDELAAAQTARDEHIRAMLRGGAGATEIAKAAGISRERVYQIRAHK